MRLLLALLLVPLLCTAGSVPGAAAERLKVVASFTILADWARTIGGDGIELTLLVGPDSDPHAFDPSPRQQAMIGHADLVIANGLGLEPWLDRVLAAADFNGEAVIASASIAPLTLGEAGGQPDPHAFQDPKLAAIYVENIRAALSAADPTRAPEYNERASRYLVELQAIEKEIRSSLASVPSQRRRVLTSHDAFGYFGRAFAIEFVPILGLNSEKAISAKELAGLIGEAREGGFAAIFLENMTDPRLAETIAGESGIAIGGRLHADALSGPNGRAPDYLALLRHNAEQLLGALR